MSKYLGSLQANIVSSVIVGSLALSLGIGFAAAGEQPTADQITRSLTPKHLTRSLSVSPAEAAKSAEEGRFLNELRTRQTRSLSSVEREKVATIAEEKPKIDLEINFDYNSADISAKSLASVQALGNALTNPDLKGSTFVVAGHTDAAGGESYNQDLSERRADAIKKYLTDRYGIAGSDLVTVGYGKSKHKDRSNPMADANRRVQVVNMENKAAASK